MLLLSCWLNVVILRKLSIVENCLRWSGWVMAVVLTFFFFQKPFHRQPSAADLDLDWRKRENKDMTSEVLHPLEFDCFMGCDVS